MDFLNLEKKLFIIYTTSIMLELEYILLAIKAAERPESPVLLTQEILDRLCNPQGVKRYNSGDILSSEPPTKKPRVS